MIDAHAHFYDSRWLDGLIWPPRDAPFYGRRVLEDYLAADRSGPIEQVILVETSPRPCDDAQLRHVAETTELIGGFIANLQPGEPGFSHRLRDFRRSPKFKGLRLRPIERFDLGDAVLRQTLSELATNGSLLELGAKAPRRLLDIAALAEACSELTVVLTHAGHPEITGDRPGAEWAEGIEAVAARGNTVLKLTPLMAFCAIPPGDEADAACAAHVNCLLQAFGVDRIMFGSNWPVSEPVGTPEDHRAQLLRCLPGEDTSAGAMDRATWIFKETARRIYGL